MREHFEEMDFFGVPFAGGVVPEKEDTETLIFRIDRKAKVFGVVKLFTLARFPGSLAVAERFLQCEGGAGAHRQVLRRTWPKRRVLADPLKRIPIQIGDPESRMHAEWSQDFAEFLNNSMLQVFIRQG